MLKVETKNNDFILTLSEKELIGLRIEIVEYVILKRAKGTPVWLEGLYKVLAHVEV